MDFEPSFYLLCKSNSHVLEGSVVIVLLLIFSAIISAAEVAFFLLTPNDLAKLSQYNPSKAKRISRLLQQPKKLLSTLLLTNNFINVAIIVLFSFVGNELFSTIAFPFLKFVLKVAFITFFILIFGKVLPKIYVSGNSLKFAVFIANPLLILVKIFAPITSLMRVITLYIQEKLGKQKSNISVNQLSQALELTSSENTNLEEQKLLEGIVSFGNTETKQVMSPRIDIFALEISSAFIEIYPKIIENEFSRIPIYEDNIDHIIGVLFVKDLIPHIHKKEFDWKELIREPFFVPETKKLDNLLKDFQNMKSHLAIVVDEYGGTSGLVSLEDVIEEIVGDISDEFDDENSFFSQIDEKNFLFEGKINLKDFFRIIAVEEETFNGQKRESETLAGFVLEILGNFPKKGQKIHFSNVLFTIESVDKKRIKQIKVTIE